MAVQPSGTVAVSAKVALSDGWSLAGYQEVAEWGSPATFAPPVSRVCQPSGSGRPAYVTRTPNFAPFATGRAGVMTSSWAPARVNFFAGTPSTSTDATVKPLRSRLNRSRPVRARAVTVVSPSRWSVRAGS